MLFKVNFAMSHPCARHYCSLPCIGTKLDSLLLDHDHPLALATLHAFQICDRKNPSSPANTNNLNDLKEFDLLKGFQWSTIHSINSIEIILFSHKTWKQKIDKVRID